MHVHFESSIIRLFFIWKRRLSQTSPLILTNRSIWALVDGMLYRPEKKRLITVNLHKKKFSIVYVYCVLCIVHIHKNFRVFLLFIKIFFKLLKHFLGFGCWCKTHMFLGSTVCTYFVIYYVFTNITNFL